jgi:hypothetical protein
MNRCSLHLSGAYGASAGWTTSRPVFVPFQVDRVVRFVRPLQLHRAGVEREAGVLPGTPLDS